MRRPLLRLLLGLLIAASAFSPASAGWYCADGVSCASRGMTPQLLAGADASDCCASTPANHCAAPAVPDQGGSAAAAGCQFRSSGNARAVAAHDPLTGAREGRVCADLPASAAPKPCAATVSAPREEGGALAAGVRIDGAPTRAPPRV